MKARHFSKLLAVILVVIMLAGALPLNVLAAAIEYVPNPNDDYYKLISKRDWELAPGVNESEIILNRGRDPASGDSRCGDRSEQPVYQGHSRL